MEAIIMIGLIVFGIVATGHPLEGFGIIAAFVIGFGFWAWMDGEFDKCQTK